MKTFATHLSSDAQRNIEETNTDPEFDVRRVYDGEITIQQLKSQCLSGADPDRVDGWLDYVDAVDAEVSSWRSFDHTTDEPA